MRLEVLVAQEGLRVADDAPLGLGELGAHAAPAEPLDLAPDRALVDALVEDALGHEAVELPAGPAGVMVLLNEPDDGPAEQEDEYDEQRNPKQGYLSTTRAGSVLSG